MTYTVATRLSGSERASLLLDAWRDAGPDTDIEIRIGSSVTGEASVLVSIGSDHHALTASEATIVADAVADTVAKFPADAAEAGLDNLLFGLREGARAALARAQP